MKNLNQDDKSVAALFRNATDAERAIQNLKNAGFYSHEISCSYSGDPRHSRTVDDEPIGARRDESFWEKVGNFFSGESDYESRSTDESRYDTRSGPTFGIPDRYSDDLERGGVLVAVRTSRVAEAERILAAANGRIEPGFWDAQREYAQSYKNREMPESRRMQLVSEALRVNKERVKSGEVRLRKEVIAENRTIDVPVEREELVIEHHEVTGDRPASGSIGDDREIRVPLSEERVNVTKDQVVTGEVSIGKRKVQGTERVSDTVRREEARVEKDGNVNVDDETLNPKRKRSA